LALRISTVHVLLSLYITILYTRSCSDKHAVSSNVYHFTAAKWLTDVVAKRSYVLLYHTNILKIKHTTKSRGINACLSAVLLNSLILWMSTFMAQRICHVYTEYLNLGILQMSRYGLNLKLEMCL